MSFGCCCSSSQSLGGSEKSTIGNGHGVRNSRDLVGTDLGCRTALEMLDQIYDPALTSGLHIQIQGHPFTRFLVKDLTSKLSNLELYPIGTSRQNQNGIWIAINSLK